MPITTTHVGPHVYTSGGTQSVIRTIRDECIGADNVSVLATWDGFRNARNAALLASAARTLAVVDRKEIVHLHISNGGGWLREGTLLLVCRARGLRTVVTIHGFNFPEFAKARPAFVRRVLSQAHHVITLSEDARDAVAALVDVDVSVVPNPIAIDFEAPPVESTPPVALFAGAIGRRKGVDVLIEAWRVLLKSGTDGFLRIVGPDDDIRPPQLPRMSVGAAVHPTKVPELIRAARLVVLPSRAEAMPMILTESLAAARPFVATDVGGVSSITPERRMLISKNDAPALAAAMAVYLNDPAAAADDGRRGQRFIMETRSPEVVGKRLREIYDGL